MTRSMASVAGPLLLGLAVAIVALPSLPEKLKMSLEEKGTDLPYFIYASLWDYQANASGPSEESPCTMILLADSTFDLFLKDQDKEEMLQNILGNKMFRIDAVIVRGASPEPFFRRTTFSAEGTEGEKGEAALKGATLKDPAFAITYDNKKIYVWESPLNGKLLANGAEILERIELVEGSGGLDGEGCLGLVVEGFPFPRMNRFVTSLFPSFRFLELDAIE